MATTVLGYLLYFQLFLWELSLCWSVPPGLTPLAQGVTQGTQGLTECFHMLFHLTHSLVLLFGHDLSFRKEGVKCDDTALTSQENSKEEFIHDKSNAKTSMCDHRLFQRPIIGNYLSSPLSLKHMQTKSTSQLCKGICFIPIRVGNLCLIYYSLKCYTGSSTLSSMSSDTIL